MEGASGKQLSGRPVIAGSPAGRLDRVSKMSIRPTEPIVSRRGQPRSLAAVAYVLLIANPGGRASAGPPYVTDDPEPTDVGKWETYAFASGTILPHSGGGESGLDINYGGGKDLQLSAVLSLAYDRQAGRPVHAGVSDTELGAKYRFLRQHDGSWLPDVGLFPKIELPTAGRRFGSGRVGLSLPLWMQKDFGRWSLFGGGGWTYNPGVGDRNYGFGGLALTRQVTGRVTIGGEIFHQTADAVDMRSSTGLGFGVTWQIAPKWSIIGSGGPLVEHRTSIGRYAFYLALAFHN